jgi:hypothetical protein
MVIEVMDTVGIDTVTGMAIGGDLARSAIT